MDREREKENERERERTTEGSLFRSKQNMTM